MRFRSTMRANAGLLLLLAGTTMQAVAANAQGAAFAGSIAGGIAASATVLPIASFEGGAVHTLSITLTPGDSARVDPTDGVRTRMRYVVPTRVTIAATPFRGPGGRTVAARLLCAHGTPGQSADETAQVSFDCAGGYAAPATGSGTSTVALAVGASLPASASRGLPPGRYTGTLTLTASAPGY